MKYLLDHKIGHKEESLNLPLNYLFCVSEDINADKQNVLYFLSSESEEINIIQARGKIFAPFNKPVIQYDF